MVLMVVHSLAFLPGARDYFFRVKSAWYISCPAPTIFFSSLS